MLIAIREQCQKPGALNRGCQLALITGAGACNPAGHDFARLGDEAFEHVQIFIINLGNALGGEPTISSAAEKAGHEDVFLVLGLYQ
jgi:hypothetical protein